MFLDQCNIEIIAGKGGDGATSFRREKFVPRGGPDGGNGGRGGHISFKAHSGLHTLYDIGNEKKFKAGVGGAGGASHCTGKNGVDLIIEVPIGTLIRDAVSDDILADLTSDSDTFMAAKGGKGGVGNSAFKSATNQAPTKHTLGGDGQSYRLRLELKLMADCGLVGFPNVGKSSLVRKLSNARPKVGDFPFTTLKPHIGVCTIPGGGSFAIADLPGLIEGAAEGKGLGLQFLRHIERTAILAFVLDPTQGSISEQYRILRGELAAYHSALLDKPHMILVNKSDLGADAKWDGEITELSSPLLSCSSLSGEGLDEFKQWIIGNLKTQNRLSSSW